MRRRRASAVGVALTALVLLGLALRWGPALTLSAALAVPSAEAWLPPVTRHVVRQEILLDADGPRLSADIYRPARPHGGLVLVHGLSPAGRRHPELVRLARLLAQRGELVLVPQFPGLAAFELSGKEVADIRAAIRYLAASTGSVGVAGFSFGAGPAVVAAADSPAVGLVGSFGGYADLRHVITFITTGVYRYRGQRHVRQQEEYNRWKLLALLVGFVEDGRDAGILRQIAARKLADPADDTSVLEANVGAAGRAVLAVVSNRREENVEPLLARLPAPARETLDRLSPLAAVARVRGRLLIAHGADDDSIPFTESLLLADAAAGRARLAILEGFHHTGPPQLWRSFAARARDAWSLVRLADDLLAGRP